MTTIFLWPNLTSSEEIEAVWSHLTSQGGVDLGRVLGKEKEQAQLRAVSEPRKELLDMAYGYGSWEILWVGPSSNEGDKGRLKEAILKVGEPLPVYLIPEGEV